MNAAGASAPVRLSLLGATGSIGSSTVDLLRRAGPGRFTVESLAAGRDVPALAALAREFGARFAAIADPAAGPELRAALAGTGIASGAGPSAVIEAAQRDCDMLIGAITGVAGLAPTLAALGRCRRLALANKECMVAAGAHFMAEAARHGTELLPVDSEHNAVFQALQAGPSRGVSRVTLTASGGPFRTASREAIARATPAEALRHPNWSMGAKVTIDSATLMNKGLELIEAHHLFALPPEVLDVVIHPQSLVHGLVSFTDGSVVAGLFSPDMRVPIAHCLAWPERMATPVAPLDLAAIGSLTFERPDEERFPALALAKAALRAGGAAPTVLNAANEVAVEAFIAGWIGLPGIPALVEAALSGPAAGRASPNSVEEALALDSDIRQIVRNLLPKFAAKAS
ncbi:1-deoxy-D-xylulose-5-phosphate reductoisomerase [Ancylobacter terrae]|uniref:1-deoxy-D-xylulose-5-phosphate reductoisomerase n=1 Tax=Ancylobacter sp. sgz301288 TaxID=3342077 RepID=UPI00385E4EA6